jgi:hypothetical protein
VPDGNALSIEERWRKLVPAAVAGGVKVTADSESLILEGSTAQRVSAAADWCVRNLTSAPDTPEPTAPGPKKPIRRSRSG